jgi:hypothetical protein
MSGLFVPSVVGAIFSLPEQTGELFEQTGAFPEIPVSSLHVLDGQSLLLRTFLGARNEYSFCLCCGESWRRAGQRLSVALPLLQILSDANNVLVSTRIALLDNLFMDLDRVAAPIAEALEYVIL